MIVILQKKMEMMIEIISQIYKKNNFELKNFNILK